jgi:hypothetical protein
MNMRFGVISLALAGALAMAVAGGTVAGTNPDTDSDSVFDLVDNCTEDANASQTDTDRDGFGNTCDSDFNNTGTVNVTDFGFFVGCLGLATTASPSGILCGNMDYNDTTSINVTDFGFFVGDFTVNSLGPSALPCASKVPSADNMTGRFPCFYDVDGTGGAPPL